MHKFKDMLLGLQRPSTYKRLYKIYAFLKFDVLKPSSFIGPLITVLSVLYFWTLTGSIAQTSVYSVALYSILWLISHLLWTIIQRAIRNTGTKEKFIFPGKYLIRNLDGDPCELSLDGINKDRFEFATEKTAALSADLNIKAYKNSLWATTFEDKFQRNLSHIRKNEFSIMFVKSLSDEKYLGYTHVFPVSKRVWDRYIEAKIGDNNFTDKLIAANMESDKHKQPYGLILFSVGSVAYDNEIKQAPHFIDKLGDLYEQAIVYHIHTYLQSAFKNQNIIEILLQNMSVNYLDFFKDCARSTLRLSADGARIIVFDVLNLSKN